MTKILDIGCGNHKVKDAIGLDFIKLEGINIVHDLTIFPYPIEDNEFDEIYCNHILEHITDVVNFMKEVHRISKLGAKVYIRAPHASCSYTCFSDPTHKRGFTTQTFEYFSDQSERSYYTNVKFRIKEKKLNYICYNGTRGSRIPRVMQNILNLFANINHLFCERIWAGWVGGFEEVYIELQVIK